jgi:meso-butanediol dehydrogenase/(S,S)-butanediol dehydrogenase/diacetyl reductase
VRLDGKVAIITGGANGIGAAVVRSFVDAGARVVIADFNEAAGSAMVAELGEGVRFSHGDVLDRDYLIGTVDLALACFGHLDIVVNNAGLATSGGLEETSVEQWDRVLGVNLTAAFVLTKAAIPHLKLRPGASVINTCSISGLAGDYGLFTYNATKAGLLNMTRSLALDYAQSGVRVNAVCPGLIETNMTAALRETPGVINAWMDRIPMRRVGLPEEVAGAYLFLASDLASYITGTMIVADGGLLAQSGSPSPNAYAASAAALP